jgi:TolA-binding protein
MRKSLLAAAIIVQSGVYGLCLSPTAAGQGASSVVESQPFTPGQGVSNNQNSPTSNNDAMSLLLDQLRGLQTEVQALRGLVEEQSFEVRKLQRDSLSRYTNIDDRLTAVETAAPALVAVSPSTTATSSITQIQRDPSRGAAPIASNTARGTSAINNPLTTTPPTPLAPVASSADSNPIRRTLEPAVLSEQQLYQMAYDSVINSNFERSIAEFDQYLSIYASGRFVTNAHYWKGQAFLYLARFDEARASYQIILDQYSEPEAPKMPDAMYGLALAYEGLGNISRARQLLIDIKRRYPNQGVSNLADTRLLSLD